MSNWLRIIMFIVQNWQMLYRLAKEVYDLFKGHPTDTKELMTQAKQVAKTADDKLGLVKYIGKLMD